MKYVYTFSIVIEHNSFKSLAIAISKTLVRAQKSSECLTYFSYCSMVLTFINL